jgi:2-beta-glucuronyltransferase
MRRVVLFSVHYLESKRRCDWHFLADAYWRGGWDVVFFTVGLSHISRLRRDHRFQYPIMAEANRLKPVKERLSSFVWFQSWHPINLRNSMLNRLSSPFFSRYGTGPLGEGEEVVHQADLLLFESTPGVMLVENLKDLNPSARFVYRVSDDTQTVGFHPVVTQAEQRFAHLFDLISLTSHQGFAHLRHLPNVAVHYHGVEKQLFDREYQNPYDGVATTNVVSVGGTLFDSEALEIASELFPRWTFHVFGWRPVTQRPNIKNYGEIPFVETVPYIKYADIGLALYTNPPGAEYIGESSLKMLQYTYCRLPIMAPAYATSKERPHIFGYTAGDIESIRLALNQALACDRTNIDREAIWNWDALADALAGDGDRGRPCQARASWA